MEGSLALAGLIPFRQQILQSLTRYLLQRHEETLVADDHELVYHRSYVSPTELGQTGFQLQVRVQKIPQILASQRWEIMQGVQRALLDAWQRRWASTGIGRQFFDVIRSVVVGWLPQDALVA